MKIHGLILLILLLGVLYLVYREKEEYKLNRKE